MKKLHLASFVFMTGIKECKEQRLVVAENIDKAYDKAMRWFPKTYEESTLLSCIVHSAIDEEQMIKKSNYNSLTNSDESAARHYSDDHTDSDIESYKTMVNESRDRYIINACMSKLRSCLGKYKQDIIDAFDAGNPNGFITKTGEQYFNENFENNDNNNDNTIQVYECTCTQWNGYSTTVGYCPYCSKLLKKLESPHLTNSAMKIEDEIGKTWEEDAIGRKGFIAGAKSDAAKELIMQDLFDDIEMNFDDWCRTPIVMATKFRDKQFKQEKL